MKLTVGIPTYNRPDILLKCLQCLASQTRQPDEIIIADASPNAQEAEVKSQFPSLPITYLLSERGIAVQRNLILTHTSHEVIFYLDDDSLVSPSYLEKIMEVYEADIEGLVGGIEGNTAGNGQGSFSFSFRNFLNQMIIKYLGPIFPAEDLKPKQLMPPSLGHFPVKSVSHLYGCVMSYRTPYAKQELFDPQLRLYSFLEDFDLSYRIQKKYSLLHHKEAFAQHVGNQQGRIDPSLVHYLYLINAAYIARKDFPQTASLKHHILKHARKYVRIQALLGPLRKKKFSQYRGAKAGLERTRKILEASDDTFVSAYSQAAEFGAQKETF